MLSLPGSPLDLLHFVLEGLDLFLIVLESLGDLCVLDVFDQDLVLQLLDVLDALELFLDSVDLHVHEGDHIFGLAEPGLKRFYFS